jgi:hypothetical protein
VSNGQGPSGSSGSWQLWQRALKIGKMSLEKLGTVAEHSEERARQFADDELSQPNANRQVSHAPHMTDRQRERLGNMLWSLLLAGLSYG